jgi:hypothetical protein
MYISILALGKYRWRDPYYTTIFLLHYDLLGAHSRVTTLQAIYLAYETFYYYRYMVGLVCYKRPLRGPCSVLWVVFYLCTAE